MAWIGEKGERIGNDLCVAVVCTVARGGAAPTPLDMRLLATRQARHAATNARDGRGRGLEEAALSRRGGKSGGLWALGAWPRGEGESAGQLQSRSTEELEV